MTEAKMEYKNTLNLPQTTLEMRANAAVKEVSTQKFWEENNIYEKTLAQRDKANKFILHDGPPYLSSDKIHIGHALNKILKDILIKYSEEDEIRYRLKMLISYHYLGLNGIKERFGYKYEG